MNSRPALKRCYRSRKTAETVAKRGATGDRADYQLDPNRQLGVVGCYSENCECAKWPGGHNAGAISSRLNIWCSCVKIADRKDARRPSWWTRPPRNPACFVIPASIVRQGSCYGGTSRPRTGAYTPTIPPLRWWPKRVPPARCTAKLAVPAQKPAVSRQWKRRLPRCFHGNAGSRPCRISPGEALKSRQPTTGPFRPENAAGIAQHKALAPFPAAPRTRFRSL